MQQDGLMFPKPGKKKKKKMKHPKSIVHSEEARTCYLCMLLDGNHGKYAYLEEHHVFHGTCNRQLSERYGVKVYLCVNHHRTGPNAVHNNARVDKRLMAIGQQAFMREYPDKDFMDVFHENFIF